MQVDTLTDDIVLAMDAYEVKELQQLVESITLQDQTVYRLALSTTLVRRKLAAAESYFQQCGKMIDTAFTHAFAKCYYYDDGRYDFAAFKKLVDDQVTRTEIDAVVTRRLGRHPAAAAAAMPVPVGGGAAAARPARAAPAPLLP